MNLTIQKVAHSAELDRELSAAIGENSPIKALQGAVDSFRELPDAFESLRRAINEACRTVKEQLKSFEDFNKTFGTTMGVGVVERIKAAGYAPGQIEIDASFARMIERIGSNGNLLEKMKALCKLNTEIASCINGWQSKASKLKERNIDNGATEAEVRVAQKKLILLEDTIKLLRNKGETVSTMFYQAKRALEGEIESIDDSLNPIFTNAKGAHHE